MSDIKWIFDGIGTELVIFVLGLIFGSGITYKIVVKNKSIKQTQKAGKNSEQTQVGEINGR